MRRIITFVTVLMIFECCLPSIAGRATFSLMAREKTSAMTVKGDIYFAYGTTFKKVLWTLQRRYPEYVRTYTEDYDGFIDLVESAPDMVTHYYFENKKYKGSETIIMRIDDGQNVLEEYINRLKKIYKKDPVMEVDDYVWSDRMGQRAMIRKIVEKGNTIITITIGK